MRSEWYKVPLRELVGYMSKGIAPVYAEEETQTTVKVLNQKCNRNFRINYDDTRLHDTEKKKVPAERYVTLTEKRSRLGLCLDMTTFLVCGLQLLQTDYFVLNGLKAYQIMK